MKKLLLCLLLLIPKSIYANEVIVDNHVEMGLINIHLQELTHDTNGLEIPFEDIRHVVPNEEVDFIARIQNKAEPCWIRTSVYKKENDIITPLDSSFMKIKEGWIKRNDYYYYIEPLDYESESDFIQKLIMPEDLEENTSFEIILKVDAVQKNHFDPNFESKDPWFGTLIETSLYTQSIHIEQKNKQYSILYENGAEGLISFDKDFFEHFGTLMPGDTKKGQVTLSNQYFKDINIFFRIEQIDDSDLAKSLELSIYDNKEKIFEGSLMDYKEEILLTKLKPKDQYQLTYELYVNNELTNIYALNNASQRWIFKAEIIEDKKGINTSDINLALPGIICILIAIILFIINNLLRKGGSK